MVGTPRPKMAVMLDVESWGGQIRGNRSTAINAAYDAAPPFGNVGDLNNLWPHKPPGIRLVVAAYGRREHAEYWRRLLAHVIWADMDWAARSERLVPATTSPAQAERVALAALAS